MRTGMSLELPVGSRTSDLESGEISELATYICIIIIHWWIEAVGIAEMPQ